MVELVSRIEALTFDEYVQFLRQHPKPRLLGPLRIHMRWPRGVPTWMVAPPAPAGAPLTFFRELDRQARLIPLSAEALDAAGDEPPEQPAFMGARRMRWSTRGRWSRFTLHVTPRLPRLPKLRDARLEASQQVEEPSLSRPEPCGCNYPLTLLERCLRAQEITIEDFRDLLRQNPELQEEALAIITEGGSLPRSRRRTHS